MKKKQKKKEDEKERKRKEFTSRDVLARVYEKKKHIWFWDV